MKVAQNIFGGTDIQTKCQNRVAKYWAYKIAIFSKFDKYSCTFSCLSWGYSCLTSITKVEFNQFWILFFENKLNDKIHFNSLYLYISERNFDLKNKI